MDASGKGKTLALLFLVTAAFCLSAPIAEPPDEVSARLKADVIMLSDTIGPRSLNHPDALKQAADYIVARFEQSGWTVRRLPYQVGLQNCENIEVEKVGALTPNEVVVVGAHYDSTDFTPGADDNASGVAALVALANHFSSTKPERTLRFVAFVNEEPPYFQTATMGSRVYAAQCRKNGDNIVAMLALESIGFFSDAPHSQHYPFPLSFFYPSRGNFLAVVGNGSSSTLTRQVRKSLLASKTLPIESASLPGSLQGVGWSDHWSFWQEGYKAVMVTDTAPFRNRHYHEGTDTPDTLDYRSLARAYEGLVRVVEDLCSTTKKH